MRSFIAASLLIISGTVARAEPAMWVVQSPTAKVYLFGTMHILPKPADWLSPKIASAFGDSQVLFEEADIGLVQPEVVSRVMNQAVSPDTDLWQMLPAETATKFRKLVQGCHLPPGVVAHFRPWFASQLPTLCELMAASPGQSFASSGPEATFITKAKQTGKRIDFFETAEQQIGYLSSSPEKVQIAQLEQAIDDANSNPAELADLEKTWLAGDMKAIAKSVADLRAHGEDFYRTVFVNRNERFAQRIAALLAGHETVFVAIGAGHFSGPDSVQAQLLKQHIEAKRI
jgi:uncharacterized protein